jgi:transcriptional antiterminator NusG
LALFDDQVPGSQEQAIPTVPVPHPRGRVKVTLKGEDKKTTTAGMTAEYPLAIEADRGGMYRVKLDISASSESGEGPDWVVRLSGIEDRVWDVTFTGQVEHDLELEADKPKAVMLYVQAPRGTKYGDRLTVTIHVASKDDSLVADAVTTVTTSRQAIMAIKTSIGHERTVADSVASRAKAKDSGIFAILAPGNLRGYVFVESMNPDRLGDIVKGIRRARGLIRGETNFEDVVHYLTPKPVVSGIVEGDIVELVAGPFKGEKARVQHIDEAKEEITVELFEAMVPIPVTVRGDHVRVIEKEER